VTPLQSFILKAICINVPIGILMLGPKDAVLKYIWAHRHDARVSLRMWHYETLAVCTLVAAVVILSGSDPVEWVGFAALTLAHGRNSVMFRLTEAQQRSSPVDPHHVECWRWNTIYFLLAECFWAGYFVLHRSWAALAGVAIFVGYGQWRRWYGRRSLKWLEKAFPRGGYRELPIDPAKIKPAQVKVVIGSIDSTCDHGYADRGFCAICRPPET
jgi:hypothetical protein